MARSEGHRHGADKIDEVLTWCAELDIPIITLWALSTENLGREANELDPHGRPPLWMARSRKTLARVFAARTE